VKDWPGQMFTGEDWVSDWEFEFGEGLTQNGNLVILPPTFLKFDAEIRKF